MTSVVSGDVERSTLGVVHLAVRVLTATLTIADGCRSKKNREKGGGGGQGEADGDIMPIPSMHYTCRLASR